MNCRNNYLACHTIAPNMIQLDFKKVDAAAMVLRAIRNPLRKKMLAAIDNNPGKSVTELLTKLGLEQSVTSQHLAILRQAGIVKAEREGKLIRYSLDYNNIKKISPLVGELALFYKGRMKGNNHGQQENASWPV